MNLITFRQRTHNYHQGRVVEEERGGAEKEKELNKEKNVNKMTKIK
jgi:hypothetical protein